MATLKERKQRRAAARSKQNSPSAPRTTKVRATAEQRAALTQARAVRDRALAEVSADIKPQIDRLQRELRDRRQKVWDEYDERTKMIRSATLLEPKG